MNKRPREENIQKFNGIQGILFTCPSNREREAKREAASILDEFVEDSENNTEIMGTQSKGWFFVRIKNKCPNEVIKNMIQKFGNDKIPSTRYLYKMFPILTTCHAKIDNISKAAKQIIDERFAGLLPNQQIKRYKLVCKFVTNVSITQKSIMSELTKHIKYYHVVDLINPDIALFVMIFRNVCLIGLIDEYTKNGKYDINRLRDKEEGEEEPEGEGEEKMPKPKGKGNKPIIMEKQPEENKNSLELKPIEQENEVKVVQDTIEQESTKSEPSKLEEQQKKKTKRENKVVGGINLF